jgi:ABC-type transport system substrate-binding protein
LTFSDGTPLNATAIKDAITRARTQQNSALIKDLEPVSNVTTAGGYDVNVYLNHPESTNTGYRSSGIRAGTPTTSSARPWSRLHVGPDGSRHSGVPP